MPHASHAEDAADLVSRASNGEHYHAECGTGSKPERSQDTSVLCAKTLLPAAINRTECRLWRKIRNNKKNLGTSINVRHCSYMSRARQISSARHALNPKAEPTLLEEAKLWPKGQPNSRNRTPSVPFKRQRSGWIGCGTSRNKVSIRAKRLCKLCWRFRERRATGFNQHSSAVHRGALALAEESFSNVFEFGQKIARVKDPQQFVQAQSDFLSRQAEILASHSKELAQNVAKETNEMTNATVREAEISRKRSAAA